MNQTELIALLDTLRAEEAEREWLEFKRTRVQPHEDLGKYISALANSAAYLGRARAYLILGVDDQTHEVVGTDFRPESSKVKGQELLFYVTRGLEPRVLFDVHEVHHPNGRVILIAIESADSRPIRFNGQAYIRVGSSVTKLSEHPQIESALWRLKEDWSSGTIEDADLDDLDPAAIRRAREEFATKNPSLAKEMVSWSDWIFLRKSRLTRGGKISRTALILLGRPEASVFLSPAVARITWLLKDESGGDLDYVHFDPPFILQVDQILERIRNLILRTMPSGKLFPTEIQQYDNYVIRETLHNAIAHQDYGLSGRIQVVEFPGRLVFTNVGSFLPGSVEEVIEADAPREIYRNPFLVAAMVGLNMIDTQGGGIRRMFERQRSRFLPLPDFDLSDPKRVKVTIPGEVLDEKYTRLLMEHGGLDLAQALLLDRVQKGQRIPHDAHKQLRRHGLVEGRYPNAIISGPIAKASGRAAEHIRARGFDNQYYRDLVLSLVGEHGPVSRQDINRLLLDKMPEALTDVQKNTKISNIIKTMSAEGLISNLGTRGQPQWVQITKDNPRGKPTKAG